MIKIKENNLSEATSRQGGDVQVAVTFIASGLVREAAGDGALWRERKSAALAADPEATPPAPALWVRQYGKHRFVTVSARPELNLFQCERLEDAMIAAEEGDDRTASKLFGDVEAELGLSSADLLTVGRAERALGLVKAPAKAQAAPMAKGKRGRKSTGLRELPPEAAALAISTGAITAVRQALRLRAKMVEQTGMSGGAPTLLRMMRQDLKLTTVDIVEDGAVRVRPALRANTSAALVAMFTRKDDDGNDVLPPPGLIFTAERFVNDVEAARIGKLSASYGEGRGGATSVEPERVICALDRLAKAQEHLTRNEKIVVWGALVFGLPLHDLGWACHGTRFGKRAEPLITAAQLMLECALERMEKWYLAHP